MRNTSFFLILLIVVAHYGCIMVPIPTKEDTVLSGTPLTEERYAFLAPMQASREEVIAHLGNPAVIWEDERVFIYNWDMRQGILLWAVGGYGGGAAGVADIEKHHLLLIQFDEQGKVQRFSRAVRPLTQSSIDFLQQWVRDAPGQTSVGQDSQGEARP